MNNGLISRISVGIVCVLLGFMITYQLKFVYKQNEGLEKTNNVAQITIEMEQLQKQKEDLEAKINELESEIKNYETAAANNDELAKEVVKKLEDTRVLMGSVDVEGEGVIVNIIPKNEFFGGGLDGPAIIDTDLIKIVNELNAADAEAISINDIRVTSRTGIRSASNYIIINEERISPYKQITIKAIGNKTNLQQVLEFPGVLDTGFEGYDIKYEVADNVKIKKYAKSFEFKYAKPINN